MNDLIKWVPVIIWSVVVFTFSSIPNLKIPGFGLGFEDKIYHCAEFIIWGMLFARSGTKAGLKPSANLIILFAIGMVFAFVDEWHQNLIPGRRFDWKDMVADWAGLGISAFFWLFLKK
ncbi:hypothetical protein COY52_02115 [Candidatus Desantisbacteria bacterium CG_4_10_14_0_8_um_filter_48_22]|uniref:VanZ-like domain-containing protein n=1 Tax=Candidatus Desantisbacteria bacterium CG_4_10_14_0_8_um_filter_48_22 TaxID=1974543 RepID=A0A2M7SEI8_9BACT|nr:MAG: hypothetical protein AUJ67_03920 [Candidatus Desantisbacteria bacterium CG1_02_49_89]PIV57293.1 MAG: hypothetical protein COS16_01150 [Candidatus Desantisbacteria bacterium CG02_land_8_20_14_3_00_49_13]PIZ17926.1 MAG: hypothetical protein COY52_02115 [Candidatus Desantisbacteria bacterium CG_4_10_14_0_8_um_filter_48_22]PJB27761.1 MAG: hypothetical protein CO111_03525 [Candidatus Desantisbacteria bacterium CG_4_9_14_3_um_filter_50_7]